MKRAHSSVVLGLLVAGCSREWQHLSEVPLCLERPVQVALLDERRPIAAIRLDGREPLPFLIDTGSTLSFVDGARAAELGLEIRRYTRAIRARGSAGAAVDVERYVRVRELAAGAPLLLDGLLSVLDDEVLRAAGCAGILGQDLLARLAIVVDVPRRTLHVLPPGLDLQATRAYLEEADLGRGAWAVIDTEFRPSPFLPLDTGGRVAGTLELEVDTGATFTSLPQAAIDALGLPEHEAEPVELRGVGGTRLSKAYRLANLELHGFRISADVYANPLEYGLLGMNVLGEFVFLLDGPAKKLWLHHREVEPDTGAAPPAAADER